MERRRPLTRGRPRSDTGGAREAFDVVQRYMELHELTANQLALRCRLTPSSVSRALLSRDTARWTPTFKFIYSIAINSPAGAQIPPALERLAAYKGPAETQVKKLLDDVEALITSLSATNASRGR